MARKAIHEEYAPKSPWLNAKKKVEKPVKPIYPLVAGELKCQYCGTMLPVERNAEVIKEYPQDKFWATADCTNGECLRSMSGWVYLA
jgi:hypothetical protein